MERQLRVRALFLKTFNIKVDQVEFVEIRGSNMNILGMKNIVGNQAFICIVKKQAYTKII